MTISNATVDTATLQHFNWTKEEDFASMDVPSLHDLCGGTEIDVFEMDTNLIFS